MSVSDPTVTRWWWIRHAPVIDGGDRLYGQEDVDCDVSDTPRYDALAAHLPDDAVWIVTNLTRTHKTAKAIWSAAGTSPAPTVEPELAEQFFGDWQGLTWPQMEARDADTYAAFWQDPSGNAPPGGESFAAVIDRTSSAVSRLTEQFSGRDIVCVAHGGSIRGAVSQALDLHHERGLSIKIDNLSLTRIDHIEGGVLNGAGQAWRVVGVNMAIWFKNLREYSVSQQLPSLTLVLGGARSGKSTCAENLIEASGGGVYIATAEAFDQEMRDRIDTHQNRRGDQWRTIEEPLDLSDAIIRARLTGSGAPVLVDCLTLWVSNLMAADQEVDQAVCLLIETLGKSDTPVVLVSSEVGLGIVPDNELARRFRDHAGSLNQRIAAVADRVIFVAAGLPLTLKE